MSLTSYRAAPSHLSRILLSYRDTPLPDNFLTFLGTGSESTALSTSNGNLATLWQDLSFSHVELSSQSYDHGITISDVILQLKDIAGLSALSGAQNIAADINRNGNVGIDDVVANLKHIVGLNTVQQCALVDSADQIIINPTSSTVADLTLVQLGDIDLSSTFSTLDSI